MHPGRHTKIALSYCNTALTIKMSLRYLFAVIEFVIIFLVIAYWRLPPFQVYCAFANARRPLRLCPCHNHQIGSQLDERAVESFGFSFDVVVLPM
jgi:hypothetical protein